MFHDENFSIIVPTYHEAKNIPALIKRIAALDFGARSFEMIIVDDNSQDGIEDVVRELKQYYPWVKLIIRQEQKSLSASAMAGFQAARYPWVILMDADLSHPPEKIPELLLTLADKNVDFVLGSRYVHGGSTDEIWPFTRKLTSQFSALIARLLLSAKVKDPLSGFFAVRKATLVNGNPLAPIGWKIGLEIMLKCRCKNIKEIPIHFSQRLYGSSKLNLKVAFDYFCHINQLLFYRLRRR